MIFGAISRLGADVSITYVDIILCHTMACFERDLHTLISGGDHVVLALYRSYL